VLPGSKETRMFAFRKFFGQLTKRRRTPGRRARPAARPSWRPALENLEERQLLRVHFNIGLSSENALGTLGTNFQPVEPQVIVNPVNPNNVLVSQQNGLEISTDGGLNFPTQVPYNPTNPNNGGDTSTVFDSKGNLFWANLSDASGTLSVYVAQLNPTTGTFIRSPVRVNAPPAGSLDDKEFLAADGNGNLFIVWTRFSNNGANTAVLLSRSGDHGQSWSSPVTVSGSDGFVWPATVSVGPNEDVYVAYHSTLKDAMGNLQPTTGQVFVVRYSNDLSTVYPKTNPFGQGSAQVRNQYPGAIFFTQGCMQARVLADPARPGYVYLVAVNDPNSGGAGDPADIVFARSVDFGAHWTTSTLESGPNNSFQLFPQMAIDPFGNLTVAWYDNRNNLRVAATNDYELDVYAKSSRDGGLSWSAASQVNGANNHFDPDTNAPLNLDSANNPIPTTDGNGNPASQTRIDDYFGLCLSGATAYVAWEGNTFDNMNNVNGQQVYLNTIGRGTLNVTGDLSGPANEDFVVASVNNNTDVQVRVDGQPEWTGPWSNVTGGITITLGSGNDTVEIQGLQLNTPVQINEGNGNNTVTVGTGDLDQILGNIVIAGGTGSNALQVEDGSSADTTSQVDGVTYTLTDQTVMRVNQGLFFGRPFPFPYATSIVYHGLASVTLDGGTTGVTYNVLSTAPATPVTINGGSVFQSSRTDTFNIEGTSATSDGTTPAVTVNFGDANDTVNISPVTQSLLQTLGGDVSVVGGSGVDTLNLDDQADTANTNVTVTDSLAWRTNTALVHFSDVDHVVVKGGSGVNNYHVQNTEPDFATEIHTGDGNDYVKVEATQGPLTVDLGANPLDTVELSANAQSLDNLAGGVTVNGTLVNGAGQGTLILDDQNTAVLSTTFPVKRVTFTEDGNGTVGGGSVTRTERVLDPFRGWITLAPLTFGFSSLANLVVNGGDVPRGGDFFNVESTPQGLTTDLYGGIGGAAFTLGATGESLLALVGTVHVHGQGGTTTLTLDDQNRPSIATYTLTGTRFDDGGVRQLSFDGVQALTVNVAANWSNTLTIQQTLASTPVTVNEGTANDAVKVGDATHPVGDIQGAVTDHGQGANSILFGPVAGGTWSISGANAGSVGPVSFTGVGNLVGGSGMDVFQFSPAGSVAGLNGGGGGDWLDYSALPTAVTVNLATGSATAVGGGAAGALSNVQNVISGRGNNTLTGSAQGNVLVGGPGNDTLTAGSGRSLLIGGSGLDTLTGGAGDDILIAGTTTFGTSYAMLDTTLATWQRTDLDYGGRISALEYNGSPALLWGSTVLDDGAADTLQAGSGQNWYFANLNTGTRDTILGRKPGEQINNGDFGRAQGLIASSGWSEGDAMAADGLGNLYWVGDFTGTFNAAPSGQASQNFTTTAGDALAVEKYSSSGALVWAESFGGSTSGDNAFPYDQAAVDSAGDLYITGAFTGTLTMGSFTLTSLSGTNWANAFVAKLDPTGKVLWARQYGNALDTEGFGIAVDGAGNVYTTGYFQGTVNFGGVSLTSPAGDYDAFVTKLDANGNTVWAKHFGGTSYNYGEGLAVTSTGYVYLDGAFSGTVAFGSTTLTAPTGSTTGDGFVAKLTSNGSVVWARAIGGNQNYEAILSLGVDATGNVYAEGGFEGTVTIGSSTLTSAGYYSMFVTKLSSGGAVQWATELGGAPGNSHYQLAVESYSLAVDAAGNVYSAGGFYGTQAFGSVSLTSAGDEDVYVAKLNNAGAVQWADAMGGTAGDAALAVAVDGAGNVYSSGYFGWVPGGSSGAAADFDAGPATYTLTSTSAQGSAFISELTQPGPLSLTGLTGLTSAGYTLRENGGYLQVVDTASGAVLQSKVLADTTAVTITAAAGVSTTLTIDFSGGAFLTPVTFTGGSGVNTLVGANWPDTWTITGAGAGKVGNVSFSKVANLVGGSATDVFKFNAGGSLSGTLNGGGGGDWLDYSAWPGTSSVTVNLVTGAASGVAGGVSNIANVRGGQGNNTLTGGGSNILIGGGGTNRLTDIYSGSAASGRSLLIGGSGSSNLTAGAAGDILVAGATSYDANYAALQSILAEWQSADSYLLRFQRLEGLVSGGLNGTDKLVWGGTVKDNDLAGSVLNGGAGLDWFFANYPGDDTINNLNNPGTEHLDNNP
jgi:hypothetical protein